MSRIPEWTTADRLRKARESAGYEQAELALMTGISRATISAAENGHRKPSNATVRLWALATGVPLAWILPETVKQETPLAEASGVSGECARRDSNPQPSEPWSGWLAPVIDLFRPRPARPLAVAL